MSRAKIFLIGSALLFTAIGTVALLKKRGEKGSFLQRPPLVQEVALPPRQEPIALPILAPAPSPSIEQELLPDADRVQRLFALDSSKLPIVETLSYTSRVPWLKGRPAWIADYASFYATSRHFIARSLNRKPDYLTQKISPGDRFNVFKKDKELQFYLLIDLSRCKMWFYYLDLQANERVLLKTYRVGLGRFETKTPSGSLTPIGKYQLGDKIAIYKPSTLGYFQNQKMEMIRVFGTRWLPFDKELEGCSESAKGFGIHGAPWNLDPATGQWVEDRSKIGKYESDGCVRLASEDIEELFSIIITKPTTVELVKEFREAKLPGLEKNL